MNRAVIYASVGNLVALIAGPITAYLVAMSFSIELQGYYYTFGSLVALRVLAEAGLGQTIIQFASHEWAKLQFSSSGSIAGDPDNKARLVSLARVSLKWYIGFGLALAIALTAIGMEILRSDEIADSVWLGPWLALCVVSSMSFTTIPIFSLIQGCGQVDDYWFYRLIVQVISGVSLWLAISAGFQLWASAISVFCTFTWSVVFLLSRYRRFIQSFFMTQQSTAKVNWHQDVWPVQWRIAVTGVASTFLIQLFTPMVFRFEGPAAAGQVGLTITLSMVIYALATNWTATKAPAFGRLIALQHYEELDRVYFGSLLMSILTVAVCVIGATCIVVVLNVIHYPLAQRVLQPFPALMLLLGSGVAAIGASHGIYLRSHKREPLTVVYVVSSAMMITVSATALRFFGVTGLAVSYFAVLALVQLPWIIWVFRTSQQDWHNSAIKVASNECKCQAVKSK